MKSSRSTCQPTLCSTLLSILLLLSLAFSLGRDAAPFIERLQRRRTNTACSSAANLDTFAIQKTLHTKWIVLVGDGPIRMVYLLLALALAEPQTTTGWPNDWGAAGPKGFLRRGTCATTLPDADDLDALVRTPSTPPPSPPPPPAGATVPTTISTPTLDANITALTTVTPGKPCIEEMHVAGVRLTFVWADLYPDASQLQPLADAISKSIASPDAIIAGLGTWFAHNGQVYGLRSVKEQYALALARLWADLDAVTAPRLLSPRYFPSLRNKRATTQKLWLTIPSLCAKTEQPHAAVKQLNALARTLHEHGGRERGWAWIDREQAMGGGPLSAACKRAVEADSCRLGSFHSGGMALNGVVGSLIGAFG